MNTQDRSARLGSIARHLAYALILTAVAGSVHADNQRHGLKGAKITGTWRVTVVSYNCTTLVEAPPFAAYITFAADGTLIETSGNSGFKPGQRSAGHGVWQRTGFNFYHAVTEAFLYFDSPPPPPPVGLKTGRQRLESGIQLTSRNSWTSEATFTFSDTTGAVYFSGCARASGERLE